MPPDDAPLSSPTPARPPRVEPPSGMKIMGVLLGGFALICLLSVGLTLAYGYFVEIKSLR